MENTDNLSIEKKLEYIYNSELPHSIQVPIWDAGYVFTFDEETYESDNLTKGVDWMYRLAQAANNYARSKR